MGSCGMAGSLDLASRGSVHCETVLGYVGRGESSSRRTPPNTSSPSLLSVMVGRNYNDVSGVHIDLGSFKIIDVKM